MMVSQLALLAALVLVLELPVLVCSSSTWLRLGPPLLLMLMVMVVVMVLLMLMVVVQVVGMQMALARSTKKDCHCRPPGRG